MVHAPTPPPTCPPVPFPSLPFTLLHLSLEEGLDPLPGSPLSPSHPQHWSQPVPHPFHKPSQAQPHSLRLPDIKAWLATAAPSQGGFWGDR